MELSEVLTSDTLKAADLQGAEPTVTIETVTAKEFDSNGEQVLITHTECTMRKTARPKPDKGYKTFWKRGIALA